MANQHSAGSAIVEYCLCGSLIAIVALLALAGLGLVVKTTIQGVGTELGALQSGKSSKLPASSTMPNPFQTLPGRTGVVDSTNDSGDSMNGAVAAPHAPAVQTAGSNGSSVEAQRDTTKSSQSTSTVPNDGSASSSEDRIISMPSPVSKALVKP